MDIKEFDNIKIICQEDCGNAPKKTLLRQIQVAAVTNNIDFVLDHLIDDIHWNIIGQQKMIGKASCKEVLEQQKESKIHTLQLHHIITHGKTAAVNGTVMRENQKSIEFSHVFLFSSAGKNAKIKEITSYIIMS